MGISLEKGGGSFQRESMIKGFRVGKNLEFKEFIDSQWDWNKVSQRVVVSLEVEVLGKGYVTFQKLSYRFWI